MCACVLLQEGTRQRSHRCACTPGCWLSHGSVQQSSSSTWRAGHCWRCCMNMQVQSGCSACLNIVVSCLTWGLGTQFRPGSVTNGTFQYTETGSLLTYDGCCFSLLQSVATHLYCTLTVLLSTGWRGASAQDPGQYGRHVLQQLILSLQQLNLSLLPTTFGHL